MVACCSVGVWSPVASTACSRHTATDVHMHRACGTHTKPSQHLWCPCGSLMSTAEVPQCSTTCRPFGWYSESLAQQALNLKKQSQQLYHTYHTCHYQPAAADKGNALPGDLWQHMPKATIRLVSGLQLNTAAQTKLTAEPHTLAGSRSRMLATILTQTPCLLMHGRPCASYGCLQIVPCSPGTMRMPICTISVGPFHTQRPSAQRALRHPKPAAGTTCAWTSSSTAPQCTDRLLLSAMKLQC